MKQTLLSFTQQPLFDAASAFLGKLGIKHGEYDTKEPLPLTAFFDDRMPQYLQDANATIDKLYDLGCVNDSSLGGTSSVENPKYIAMNIFAFDAKPQARITRTVVSSLTRAFNRIADDPVILIIRQGNNVTLSTCDREKGAKVEIMGKVTILRNIDCTNPHPGHIQILDRIAKEVNGCSDFDTLYKKWLYSFSLKLLSDDFFDGYKAIYEDIIALTTGKRMKKEGNKWVERVDDEIPAEEKATYGAKVMASFAQFEDPEKAVRDYVKKLMGRLVFIQFLQKKGWMGVPADKAWGEGDRDFIQNVFKQSANKDNFVDEVLEPLFRDINTDRAGYLVTSPKVNFDQQIKVPYLNGGLFEEDAYDRADFAIPAKYFWNEEATLGTKDKELGLLQFFAKYNFTIDENAPDDVEVGVDPEMLGRIFENLLEDNKDKGAFYTPKEIVHYMCRESLIAYLTTYSVEHGNTNPYDKIEAAIRTLVISPAEIVPQMRQHKPQALLEFGDALRNVKICDPAIGSGAFPMGLLNELVRCREAIGAWAKDEDGNLLVDNRAALKCEIVCNNIYGVDIERGAIDIARLRFWLSIVVDEKTPQTLPNLDYKFMQGNSLITTFDGEYVNLDTKTQQHINIGKMNEEKKKLYNYKVQYYSATGDQKHKLAVQIKNSILTLISLQLDFEYRSLVEKNAVQTTFLDEKTSFAEVKAQLSPEKQRICDLGAALRKHLKDENKSLTERSQVDIRFFDWRMMFTEVFEGENPGFDIVIGNPPYIQLQANEGALANLYEPCKFKTFDRMGDIYSLFYEHGNSLLKTNGALCYITSNKWMRTGYGEKTRKFFKDDVCPRLLVDFIRMKLFDDATVETNILLFTKANYDVQTRCSAVIELKKNELDKLTSIINDNIYTNVFDNSDFWVLSSSIVGKLKAKLKSSGQALKDWDLNILRGVLTGYNDAFVISGEKRNEILKACVSEQELERTKTLIAPVIRGRDVQTYQNPKTDLWLISTFPSKQYDIEMYPAVKNFILSFGMERVEQTGIKRIINGQEVKARKKTKHKWFETQDPIAYWEDLAKPKIVWKRIGSILRFAYDEDKSMCLDSTCFATGKYVKFLCALFNSKLGHFILQDSPKTGTGDLLVSVQAIEPIHVPMPDEDFRSKIENDVDRILSAKKSNPQSDTSSEEHEIDRLVYELYGLTNGEVKIIDPNETTVGSDDDLFKA